ncbi:MAG: hypothetical protein ABIZ49_13220, partial [Opitutaceae bacterium]
MRPQASDSRFLRTRWSDDRPAADSASPNIWDWFGFLSGLFFLTLLLLLVLGVDLSSYLVAPQSTW